MIKVFYHTSLRKKGLIHLNWHNAHFYHNITHCTSNFFSFFETALHDLRFYIERFPMSFWYFHLAPLVPESRLFMQRWSTLHYSVFYYSHGQSIWDKIKFSCEIVQHGKFLISIFQLCSTSIKKVLVEGEDWALGYNSMKFWYFSDLS